MADDDKTLETKPEPKPETKPDPKPEPAQGRVWTDEYVQGLREEAKGNRVKAKSIEAKLKALIGLKDDEDIDDAKITAYQTKQQTEIIAAIEKANARLIQAEIKSLDGYDAKLVERLLDKSKVKIADDGTVTGLKEAAEALAVEFPQVKVTGKPTGANPPPAGAKTEKDEYDELLKLVRANPNDSSLKQRLFMAKEKLK